MDETGTEWNKGSTNTNRVGLVKSTAWICPSEGINKK